MITIKENNLVIENKNYIIEIYQGFVIVCRKHPRAQIFCFSLPQVDINGKTVWRG